MNQFVMAIIGGVMIGLSASFLLLSIGRVSGISGITGSLLKPSTSDWGWRLSFVSGLLGGGLLLSVIKPEFFVVSSERSIPMMIVAGLLVGLGTQMGSGCTSGHGVCGLSRLSQRSLVATLTFIGAGMLISTLVGVL
jgi:uncharacterized protein